MKMLSLATLVFGTAVAAWGCGGQDLGPQPAGDPGWRQEPPPYQPNLDEQPGGQPGAPGGQPAMPGAGEGSLGSQAPQRDERPGMPEGGVPMPAEQSQNSSPFPEAEQSQTPPALPEGDVSGDMPGME